MEETKPVTFNTDNDDGDTNNDGDEDGGDENSNDKTQNQNTIQFPSFSSSKKTTTHPPPPSTVLHKAKYKHNLLKSPEELRRKHIELDAELRRKHREQLITAKRFKHHFEDYKD